MKIRPPDSLQPILASWFQPSLTPPTQATSIGRKFFPHALRSAAIISVTNSLTPLCSQCLFISGLYRQWLRGPWGCKASRVPSSPQALFAPPPPGILSLSIELLTLPFTSLCPAPPHPLDSHLLQGATWVLLTLVPLGPSPELWPHMCLVFSII